MKTNHRLAVIALLANLLLIGCKDNSADKQPAPNTDERTAREPVDQQGEAEIQAALAKLSPADRKLAEEQRFCAVQNDNRLGSMGTPVKITVKDQPVFLCCKGCTKKAQSNPDQTLAKVKELKTKSAPAPENLSGGVSLLRIPDRGIQPQVVVDSKGIVHMIYFKGEAKGGDLFYVHSADGENFSHPLRCNNRPNAIAIGNIRGAHLAVGKNGRVHAAWFGVGEAEGSGPSKKETPLLYTRLNDAGTAFEPERNVIQFAFGLDGGGSIAADDAGNVYVAWHAGGPDAKGEEGRRVWVARSTDEGKTFTREKAAYGKLTGACGCCGLRAFVDSKGAVYVLYRAATEGVHRDTYLLTSKDKGASFEGDDIHPWHVGSCPMSSYGFAESSGGVLAAWETEGQDYYARIDQTTGKRSEPVAHQGRRRAGSTRSWPATPEEKRSWSGRKGWVGTRAAPWRGRSSTRPANLRPKKDRPKASRFGVWWLSSPGRTAASRSCIDCTGSCVAQLPALAVVDPVCRVGCGNRLRQAAGSMQRGSSLRELFTSVPTFRANSALAGNDRSRSRSVAASSLEGSSQSS
jgi:hypothetical protein